MARLVFANPGTIEAPDQELLEQGPGYAQWIVTVFNNETNTYEQVISILMLATGCDYDEAWIETWEVDNLGKSVVHHSGEDECLGVAKTIAQIGIRVEVTEE